MRTGYVLIVGQDEKELPGMMSYDDFMLLWEDAHKQNPSRWDAPPVSNNTIHITVSPGIPEDSIVFRSGDDFRVIRGLKT